MPAAKKDNVDDAFDKEVFRRIGARLKHYRKSMGYDNYEKFANAFNIPRATYGKHERGVNLTMKSLLRYLRVMKINEKEFFGDGY
jgi:transcriptional regulator with XRE-family HTH domain